MPIAPSLTLQVPLTNEDAGVFSLDRRPQYEVRLLAIRRPVGCTIFFFDIAHHLIELVQVGLLSVALLLRLLLPVERRCWHTELDLERSREELGIFQDFD